MNKPCRKHYRRKQEGAALILALVVVSMVVLLATTLGNDFLVTFKRVENQLYNQQARSYLLSAESFFRFALIEDMANPTDTESEWAPKEFIFEDQVSSVIEGRIDDLQGRINLNYIASSKEPFIRLLQLTTEHLDQPVDSNQAIEISNAVIDWLDKDASDAETLPGGAESISYRDMEPPMRAANQAMVSVSELRLVKGISEEIYQAVKSYVTVYGNGSININTASATVLRTLNKSGLPPFSEVEVSDIISEREESGTGLEDLSGMPANLTTGIVSHSPVFKSQYFKLTSSTEFEDRRYTLYSIVERSFDNKTVKVIARSQGAL
jgi:general secretion pathway protein K